MVPDGNRRRESLTRAWSGTVTSIHSNWLHKTYECSLELKTWQQGTRTISCIDKYKTLQCSPLHVFFLTVTNIKTALRTIPSIRFVVSQQQSIWISIIPHDVQRKRSCLGHTLASERMRYEWIEKETLMKSVLLYIDMQYEKKLKFKYYNILVNNKDLAKIPTDLNFRSHKEQLMNFSRKSKKIVSGLGGPVKPT